MATRLGTYLDRYKLDAELGRGAMGVVYRARDPKLGRTVAIKTVSIAGLEPDAEQEYRRRFVVEAQAAGRLSHPGIVTVFDVREETEPYLVMEYVEGQSLQQLVSRENCTLPLSTTLRLVQEVAEALHYAHTQGVVHRDIKPANILVTPDGHPKIADFGIAKLNQIDLTLPGQVLGSPAFMAPEQLSEDTVDSRSDLFSLGVILYYMLTGHRPFQGNSTTTVCFKLVNHEPVPVSALGSKIPPELDAIVARAIAKDPAQRYQSGLAMASDLQALREHSGFIPSSDRSERTPQRDMIPRFVTRTSAAGKHESEQRVENNGISRKKKSVFSTALLFAVVTVAVAGIALWSRPGSRSSQIIPVEAPPAVDQIKIKDVSPPAGGNEPASLKASTPKISTLKPKRSISPAKRSVPVTSASDTTASVTNTSNPTAPEAMLQIEIEHHFANVTASVWVDNALVYTQSLHGDEHRHGLIFRKVVGRQFQAIGVALGNHQVRVRIQSAADSYDQSRVSSVAFMRGVNLLRIVCSGKTDGLQVSFRKDGYQ